MNRLLAAALFAALLVPQIAGARGPAYDAPDLAPGAARQMREPVMLDRQRLNADLDALASDISALKDVARGMRSRRARRALRRRIKNLEQNLRRARATAQQAPTVRPRRRRPKPVVYEPAPRMDPEPAEMAPEPEPEPAAAAATGAEMNKLMVSMEAATFRDDKLRVIRAATDHHWFTTEQARQLAEQLAFGDDRVTAVVTMYPKLVDPENAHSLYSLLPHASDRKALERRLNSL